MRYFKEIKEVRNSTDEKNMFWGHGVIEGDGFHELYTWEKSQWHVEDRLRKWRLEKAGRRVSKKRR